MNIHHIAVYLHRYDLKMKKNTMALPALQRRIILHRFYSITIFKPCLFDICVLQVVDIM